MSPHHFRGLAIALALLAGPVLAAPAGAPRPVDTRAFDGVKPVAALPNATRLAWLDLGDPKGRPTVLIHGYTDNARDWAPVTPFLGQGRRLIVVDLRGHGQSSKPECCYTRQDLAYDIKLLLDDLKIEKADVVGHSLGSIVAQTFAQYWPDRTRKVVLISSTAGKAAGEAQGMDFVTPILALKDPIDPDSAFMHAWWHSPTPVDPAFMKRQREDSAKIPAGVWKAVIFQGMLGMDLKSTLPMLKAPTLLIWGDQDTLMLESDRKGLIAALPAAQVKVYQGLGHNPFWEEPERVAADIGAFLEK
ncbi:alpha/beta fold hydrolase [Caulobacter mirabilis]|uniref:Alpha/beta hydrolase n=1 Tax=Caulobacter mirabilis TaxID=69666 RepID=A0A2D2AWY6_9CAUL|nr:alpha/beta hydrolase [Caulobacter mirabilis]ATQ42528.1 alpha/beta hydrolase [Caulobacter mirabilis]